MIHCVEVPLGLAADNIGDEVRDKLKGIVSILGKMWDMLV